MPDFLVVIGEQHLNYLVTEYVAHYHEERRRQGLGNELIGGTSSEEQDAGPEETASEVVCHERLGGLLKHYEWKAA